MYGFAVSGMRYRVPPSSRNTHATSSALDLYRGKQDIESPTCDAERNAFKCIITLLTWQSVLNPVCTRITSQEVVRYRDNSNFETNVHWGKITIQIQIYAKLSAVWYSVGSWKSAKSAAFGTVPCIHCASSAMTTCKNYFYFCSQRNHDAHVTILSTNRADTQYIVKGHTQGLIISPSSISWNSGRENGPQAQC